MAENKANKSSTTQNFLDVYDITNNFVILKDGTVSIVLTVNAMNFGLLAEAEQDAVIYSYAALLNSLNYTIQILIQSKTKDATTYLNRLKAQEEKASSTNKRQLIGRYRQFVSELIKERNVLDKKFYVVVPASALELGLVPAKNVLPGNTKFDVSTIERSVLLEKAASNLDPKKDHLIAQFNRIGLYAKQLNTQEIIQIFYNNYNPESYEGQEITDSNNYTTPLVQAQIIGGNMNSIPTSNQINNAAQNTQQQSDSQAPPMASQQTASQNQTAANPTVVNNTNLPAKQTANTQSSAAASNHNQPAQANNVPANQNSPANSGQIQEPVTSLDIPQTNTVSAPTTDISNQKLPTNQNKQNTSPQTKQPAAPAQTIPATPAAPAQTAPAAAAVSAAPEANKTSNPQQAGNAAPAKATASEISQDNESNKQVATNQDSSQQKTQQPTQNKADIDKETAAPNSNNPEEQAAQAAINQTIQQLGADNSQQATQTEKTKASPADTDKDNAQQDLPPLPEI